MTPHSSTLAWKIPWTAKPGRLQSMRSRRVGHDCATSLSLFTFMHWRRKWQPTPVFLPGESQGRGGGASWAAVIGVAESQIGLKRLSSSSSHCCYLHEPPSCFLMLSFLLFSNPAPPLQSILYRLGKMITLQSKSYFATPCLRFFFFISPPTTHTLINQIYVVICSLCTWN